MKLTDIRDGLLTIGKPVYHYDASTETGNAYIVWAEESEGTSQHYNNEKKDLRLQGSIDYFTKTEYDPAFDLIIEYLNQSDLEWRIGTIQYESDTKYIHYEFTWEVAYG